MVIFVPAINVPNTVPINLDYYLNKKYLKIEKL